MKSAVTFQAFTAQSYSDSRSVGGSKTRGLEQRRRVRLAEQRGDRLETGVGADADAAFRSRCKISRSNGGNRRGTGSQRCRRLAGSGGQKILWRRIWTFSQHDSEYQQKTEARGECADDTGFGLKHPQEAHQPRRTVLKTFGKSLVGSRFACANAGDDFGGKIVEEAGRRDFMPLEFQQPLQVLKIIFALVHVGLMYSARWPCNCCRA